MPLSAGDAAPSFRFRDGEGNVYSNDTFLGKKNLVLAYYELAFTGG